jgi:hypothetical protein
MQKSDCLQHFFCCVSILYLQEIFKLVSQPVDIKMSPCSRWSDEALSAADNVNAITSHASLPAPAIFGETPLKSIS